MTFKENFVLWSAFIALVVTMVGMVYLISTTLPHQPVYYNCAWAEISPDIPLKVKDECRKLRTDKIK